MEDKTDRELLEEIHASQMRVERIVSEFIEVIRPSVEALSKGGIMGMLGSLRG